MNLIENYLESLKFITNLCNKTLGIENFTLFIDINLYNKIAFSMLSLELFAQ